MTPTARACNPVDPMVVSGDQDAQRWTSLPAGAATNARGAVWPGADDWPDDCFEATTDPRVWDEAGARWHAGRSIGPCWSRWS